MLRHYDTNAGKQPQTFFFTGQPQYLSRFSNLTFYPIAEIAG
jgi:hypothetical protein